jgi:hypothetical protein
MTQLHRYKKPAIFVLFLLFLFLVGWGIRGLPWEDILQALRQLSLPEIITLLILDLFILTLFSNRWWLILRLQGNRVAYRKLIGYRLAAFAVSYFTPGTQFGGEPLQVYWLGRRHGVPAAAAVSSVALDRIFELLGNFAFLGVGIIVILVAGPLSLQPGLRTSALFWAVAMFCLPLCYLFGLWAGRRPLKAILQRIPAWQRLARMREIIDASEQQAGIFLRSYPLAILWIGLLSGLIWCLALFEYWLMLRFMDAHLTLTQTIIGLTSSRLAFLTPIPGGLGVLEAGQAMTLAAFGFPPALGISVSLLMRMRDTALGLIGLAWGGILERQWLVRPTPATTGD